MSLPRYPTYKDSGVEWLGEVPGHWNVQRIKLLFNIGRGRVIAQDELIVDAPYPVFSSQTLDDGCLGYINTYDFDCKQITWTTDGANAGTVFLREGKHNCTNVCGTLQPKDNFQLIEYVFYCLQYATQFYKRPDTNGAKIMNGEMAEILVTLPPPGEQQTITTFLDRETGKIDALIAEQQRLVELLAEKRQAVISHAVTKGLNPNVPMKKSGIAWLGEVPEHWRISKLKHLARFSGGGTPSREKMAYWNGDIPWVSPKDMKREFIDSAEESITSEGLQNSTAALLPTGRVLMVVRSGILQHTIPVAINVVPVSLNQDMKALSFKVDECFNKFFLRWVQGLNDLLLLAWAKQGATVESIEHAYMAETIVPLPSIEEQQTIVAFLDDETAKFDTLTAEANRAISLLQERRSALISAAVTGKIDVRGIQALPQ